LTASSAITWPTDAFSVCSGGDLDGVVDVADVHRDIQPRALSELQYEIPEHHGWKPLREAPKPRESGLTAVYTPASSL
jgi:hypothetical protein